MTREIKKILKGLRCETCTEQRTFGNVPNSEPDNLYVYSDMVGNTRVFCKDHHQFEDGKPYYGAILLKEIIEKQVVGKEKITEKLEDLTRQLQYEVMSLELETKITNEISLLKWVLDEQ